MVFRFFSLAAARGRHSRSRAGVLIAGLTLAASLGSGVTPAGAQASTTTMTVQMYGPLQVQVPFVGGSGPFSYSSTTCAYESTSSTAIVGGGGRCSTTANGTFNSVACGTGTASGTGTEVTSPLIGANQGTVSVAFNATYANGAGVILGTATWASTGETDGLVGLISIVPATSVSASAAATTPGDCLNGATLTIDASIGSAIPAVCTTVDIPSVTACADAINATVQGLVGGDASGAIAISGTGEASSCGSSVLGVGDIAISAAGDTSNCTDHGTAVSGQGTVIVDGVVLAVPGGDSIVPLTPQAALESTYVSPPAEIALKEQSKDALSAYVRADLAALAATPEGSLTAGPAAPLVTAACTNPDGCPPPSYRTGHAEGRQEWDWSCGPSTTSLVLGAMPNFGAVDERSLYTEEGTSNRGTTMGAVAGAMAKGHHQNKDAFGLARPTDPTDYLTMVTWDAWYGGSNGNNGHPLINNVQPDQLTYWNHVHTGGHFMQTYGYSHYSGGSVWVFDQYDPHTAKNDRGQPAYPHWRQNIWGVHQVAAHEMFAAITNSPSRSIDW
jgi:hypothetical protein